MSVKVVVEITEGKDGSFGIARRIETGDNPTGSEIEGATALFELIGTIMDITIPKKGGAE